MRITFDSDVVRTTSQETKDKNNDKIGRVLLVFVLVSRAQLGLPTPVTPSSRPSTITTISGEEPWTDDGGESLTVTPVFTGKTYRNNLV